jgi:hypothetical protein
MRNLLIHASPWNLAEKAKNVYQFLPNSCHDFTILWSPEAMGLPFLGSLRFEAICRSQEEGARPDALSLQLAQKLGQVSLRSVIIAFERA